MFPVSTRLEAVDRHGILPVAQRLLDLGARALVLEGPGEDGAFSVDATALRGAGFPVVAVIAPAARVAGRIVTVATRDDRDREPAAVALQATIPVLAATRARSLLVRIGAARLPGEDDLRAGLEAGSGAPERISVWKVRQRDLRAARAEAICRDLFGLAQAISPRRLLLLPDRDPLGFLDLETAEWVFSGLGRHGVGLALDSGDVDAAAAQGGAPTFAAWTSRFDSKLGFLLISAHDSSALRANPAMSGSGETAVLRDVIGRSLPRAWRPIPRTTSAEVCASLAAVAAELGPVGDMDGW